ncbi:putative toxin-antitoxin system toxin component, PIN family [Chitinimonas sp. BJYL2]|uniref:putative toxin-antitoxin system toxin component, PIN family n=1 Tax=Chitinimonas sp. BJYL2 TaxID=2976696 RepID=UPI0022B49B75|nr:putative toxin-antitoxin system toxin component, PIN family [Chitinimonas sp. BJYL2]
MKAKRAVIDTNVLISAALSANTPPAQVVRWFVANGTIVFSADTFAEFETRIWRPKFDRYLSMETRKALLHDFGAIADWVDLSAFPAITAQTHSRDVDDDKFIHTALAAGADYLVSGDADLLTLAPITGLEIVESAVLWGRLLRDES